MRDEKHVKLLIEMSLNAAESSQGETERFFIKQSEKLIKELKEIVGKNKKVVVKSKKLTKGKSNVKKRK